jgi:hypothetical protein
MKSVLDNNIREELIERIHSLTPQHTPHWGKMNVHQMMEHCVRCDDMYHGKLNIKRVLIGRLLGTMLKKRILKKDMLFGKNSPTAPIMKIAETGGDMDTQKKEWQQRIEQYGNYNSSSFIHPFFGPMTKEEVGVFAYKHADHHLRQFGA